MKLKEQMMKYRHNDDDEGSNSQDYGSMEEGKSLEVASSSKQDDDHNKKAGGKKKKNTKETNNENNNDNDNDDSSSDSSSNKNDYQKTSVLDFKRLFKPWEWIVTCDHYPTWREHLAWSKDGSDLRHYVTARMSSNMVVLTLLLSALISFLFDSGDIPSAVRNSLYDSNYNTLAYYIGLEVLVSIFVTLYAILSTFTAWGMVMAIADSNVTPLLRSPMGQYTIELTTRLVLLSLLLFLLWCTLLVIYLVNMITSILFVSISALYYLHVVSTYSAFGRTILYSGAMQNKTLFEESELDEMMPKELHQNLIQKCEEQKSKRQSPAMQYKKGHLRRWWNAIFRGQDNGGSSANQTKENNEEETDTTNNQQKSTFTSWFSRNDEEDESPPKDRKQMEDDLKHSPEAKDANFENKHDVEEEVQKMKQNKEKQEENQQQTQENKEIFEKKKKKKQRNSSRRRSRSGSNSSTSIKEGNEDGDDCDSNNEQENGTKRHFIDIESGIWGNKKDSTDTSGGDDDDDGTNTRNHQQTEEGSEEEEKGTTKMQKNDANSIQTRVKDGIHYATEMVQSHFAPATGSERDDNKLSSTEKG